jgi:hypothetical protein
MRAAVNTLLPPLSLALLFVACSSDGGVPGDDDPCGFGSDDYFPYATGHTWDYRVTDLATGLQTTKTNVLTQTMDHPDYGPVIVQDTTKSTGKTVSFTSVVGDTIVRHGQEDHDDMGALERTTKYQPAKLRLDQSAARTTTGASFTESYTQIDYDPAGVQTMSVVTTEEWDVLGVDVECTAPLGTFSCLHLSRVRTVGGVAAKEFWYGRGIGKIKETGGVIEELTGCSKAQ